MVSTDHCPFCFKDQKELGLGDFSKIPNGIGGVEHRMDLLYQGVVDGEISLERWVEICSHHPGPDVRPLPAQGRHRAGLRRRHRRLRPERRRRRSASTTHHMNMDYSAYEGFEIDGKVDTVLSRGTVVIENDTYVGRKGHGKYLKRGLSQYLH